MSTPDAAPRRDPDDNVNPASEAEISPDAAHVISKARRSFGFSLLILMLGFIAIAVALVYRSARTEGTPAVRYGVAQVGLPAGADLISAVPSEGMIALTYRLNAQTVLRLVDGKSGAVLRDIPVSQP